MCCLSFTLRASRVFLLTTASAAHALNKVSELGVPAADIGQRSRGRIAAGGKDGFDRHRTQVRNDAKRDNDRNPIR